MITFREIVCAIKIKIMKAISNIILYLTDFIIYGIIFIIIQELEEDNGAVVMNECKCEFCLYYEECDLTDQANDNKSEDCLNFVDLDFVRKSDNSYWEEMSYNCTKRSVCRK